MSDKYQRFDQFVQKRRGNNSNNTASGRRRTAGSPKGQQEKLIDSSILALHRAMLDKILADPTLLPPLIEALEQEQQQGLLRHSEYLFWRCAFAVFHQPELFKAALLSREPQACKYRRRTRLRGILSEQERQQALNFEWPSSASAPSTTTP